MQIVDDGTPTQIEEILAQAAIACAASLPVTDVGQGMLNRHPLTQFAASLLGFADPGVIRRAELHQDECSHCVL